MTYLNSELIRDVRRLASVPATEDYLKALSNQFGWRVEHPFRGIELETKFAYQGKHSSRSDVLSAGLEALNGREDVVAPPWFEETSMLASYWLQDGSEVSLTQYRGRPILKRKSHARLADQAPVVFRSQESFESNITHIATVLSSSDLQHLGALAMYKTKTYLFDAENLAAYCLVFSDSTAGDDRWQRQVELELRGQLINGHDARDPATFDEASAISDLRRIVRLLEPTFALVGLTDDDETKAEYLARSSDGRLVRCQP